MPRAVEDLGLLLDTKNYFSFVRAGVGKILGYDHETEAGLIQQEMQKLMHECREAQDDIQEEIETKRQEFHVRVSAPTERRV